ncbi:MAG: hypothetical protein K2X03_03725 [Bryobacteraceae bacterium]|nr:hypothetical protein [Bryobacteraceae bacterium]
MTLGLWFEYALKIGAPTLAAGVVIVVALIQKYGEGWLSKRFDAELAKLKHQQQQELDRNRDEVQRMFDRIVKIHDKEFEVYPQAWLMLQTLCGTTFQAMNSGVNGSPDFEKIKEGDGLEDFLLQITFTEHQKKLLRNATSEARGKLYAELDRGNKLDAASESARLLKNYLLLNEVFMTPEIADLFDKAHKQIQEAIVGYNIGRQHDRKMYSEALRVILEESPSRLPPLKEAIQMRLGFPATLPPSSVLAKS